MVVGQHSAELYASRAMVHLRIVVPSDRAEKVLDLLEASPSACNLVFLAGAPRSRPRAT